MRNARTNLAQVFGFDAFRPGQEAVVEALVAGRPSLAVFPTGGGKSLCYQLPALQFEGLTLVISPLLALMREQVEHLRSLGIAAARLDSTVSREEVVSIYDDMAKERLKLLYVAPERLVNEGFRIRLRRTQIAMLAIDEAHCISEWGHNFRPDYLKIAVFAEELGIRRVLALTATATPSVASDIRRAFSIEPVDHIQTGFYRENLTLRVHRCTSSDRLPRLIGRLQELPTQATILYVTLQKTAERVAAALQQAGLSADVYHAGLKPERRAAVQDAFMSDQTKIVVATIAFGMGIDKSNIRAVFHYNLPKSLEGYSQEIGRAGRDGEPSVCELFACAADQAVLDNFSYGDTPTDLALAGLVKELLGAGPTFSIARRDLSKRHDIRELVVATVLTYLELEGVLESTGPFYAGQRIRFINDRNEVFARFNPSRASFLKAIVDAGTFGRTWYTLDIDAIAGQISEPRERILAALGYLEQRGDIESRPSGLRHGYRRPEQLEVEAITRDLVAKFELRERNDIQRTQRVLDFAMGATCLSQSLVGYFGEQIEACGHCGPCLGEPGGPLPRGDVGELGTDERRLIEQLLAMNHRQLQHPRAMTRFLCGLRSPATGGRGGLQRTQGFGELEAFAFQDVLRFVESLQPAL